MYVVKCYDSGRLVSVLCCSSYEIAELRMELELLEFPDEDCFIESVPLWKKQDIGYLKYKIDEYKNGKEP